MIHSQVLHLLNAVFSLYLFVLFAWWWMKNGDATYIYRITCCLMFGLFLTHLGAAGLYCFGFKSVLLESWYWPYRQYFVLFPLIAYSVHITKKIWKK